VIREVLKLGGLFLIGVLPMQAGELEDGLRHFHRRVAHEFISSMGSCCAFFYFTVGPHEKAFRKTQDPVEGKS